MTFPYILLFFVTQQTDGSQCFLIFEHVLSRVSNVIDIMTITLFFKECIPLTIIYYLYFLCISKVSSMLHHGSVRRVHSKERHSSCTYTFLTLFFIFDQKIVFFSFSFFFFYEVSNFRHRILTNQKPKQVIRSCQCNCIQKTR